MYNPPYSQNSNQSLAWRLVQEHPFGMVLSSGEGSQEASFLPFLIKQQGEQISLFTHLARANPHQHYLDGCDVQVFFQGPNRYISPAVYVEPLNVPTWNYMVVECQGQAALMDSPAEVEEILRQSVVHFEAANGTNWQYDLPQSFRDELVKEIVGLKIEVKRIEAKFKLGQKRSKRDQASVAAFLAKSTSTSDQQMLQWMQILATE